MMFELFKRSLTAALMLLFFIVIFFYGNNTIIILTIYTFTVLAFYEWLYMHAKSIIKVLLFSLILFVIHYLNIFNMYFISLSSIIFWIFLLSFMFFNPDRLKNILRKNHTLIGFVICTSFFIHLLNLYPSTNIFESENNLLDNKIYFLMLIFFISSIDISAYIFGKFFGKYKIVPNISPNKTTEGYLGAYISTLLLFFVFFYVNQMIWTMTDLFFLNIFILLAFSGDLFISFVKRVHKIKDTSNILPGHGGLLDRLDSYLPSLPLYYIWFML
jgi:phosphatidate cytidylyltransferase